MDEYTKTVLAVVRLVAGGCAVVSLCLYLPDLFLLLADKPTHSTWILVGKGIPFVIGVALFWKSGAIAERLTNDLD